MGRGKVGEKSILTGICGRHNIVSRRIGGMRNMIERLERYLERKGLELNVVKTRIVRFRKRGGRLGKVDWRWKGKKIQ